MQWKNTAWNRMVGRRSRKERKRKQALHHSPTRTAKAAVKGKYSEPSREVKESIRADRRALEQTAEH